MNYSVANRPEERNLQHGVCLEKTVNWATQQQIVLGQPREPTRTRLAAPVLASAR